FLGDISFNNDYISLYEAGVNPFAQIYNELSQCDYVIGNLECFCKGLKVSTKPSPKLYTTCETLNYLNNIPVNILTLANNHAGDNYEEGFAKTIRFLEDNSIQYLGASLNQE